MAQPQPLNLQPEQAIEFLENKGYHFGFDWRDTAQQYHAASFTVAKAMNLHILADIRTALHKAMREGQSFQQFRAGLEPLLVKKGWWGRQKMRDPATGEIRYVQLGSKRRLRIIFDTNMRSAHAHGQWQRIRQVRESRPYLLYDAVMDSRTRPQHANWNGIVLPVDHPWWETHFPPNGWHCRCGVIQLSESDLESRGLVVTADPPTATRPWRNRRTGIRENVPIGIDPGFAQNVGQAAGGILAEAVRNNTVPALVSGTAIQGAQMWRDVMRQEGIAAAWSERVRHWIRSPDTPGTPDAIVVGALRPEDIERIPEHMRQLPASITLTREQLATIGPERQRWDDITDILLSPTRVWRRETESGVDLAYELDSAAVIVQIGRIRRGVQGNWVAAMMVEESNPDPER